MSPKLQEALQSFHLHQLAKCVLKRTRGLVKAPLCNHTEIIKKFLFFMIKGSAPNSSMLCRLSTLFNYLNVLGGGPVLW